MNRREMLALAAAVVAAFAAALRIARTVDVDTEAVTPTFRESPSTPRASDDSLEAAAGTTVMNDPFRLANHPAAVRFTAREVGSGIVRSTPPAAQRPVMTVQAIVGGPPWQAIVDGIPGQQAGVVVSAGSAFDKLRVKAVGRDTVTVQGPDTTWKLTLKRDRP